MDPDVQKYLIDHAPSIILAIFGGYAYYRVKVTALRVAKDLKTVVNKQHEEVVEKIEDNTELTHASTEQAKFAFREANDVNTKLLGLHQDNVETRRQVQMVRSEVEQIKGPRATDQVHRPKVQPEDKP